MHGREGERRIHRRHMWSVPAPSTSSVAVSDSVAAITSDSLSKDGRKICVGDCALFKPPQDTPPFIGIIRRLILGKEENLSLSVNWLYRPADVKLGKGTSLEPAPNEVFYSFHKDEIPAASLLHPCKVAFLPKGVELPSGISSFVCRRVYDIENKCLWWLTDQDYINERQEEVDKLLDKTRLEMYGAVQSGGRSPKRLNGPTGTLQSRPGSESVQNSSSPLPSQVKGKKRDRADQGSDPVERERVFRADDTDSGQFRPEHLLKSEIAKITDKGGLVDFEGVKRLVQLIQPDSAEKKIDLTCRRMLVDVIADTDRFDCLGWFVQLRGLSVLHEWLQEVHKGKIGDGSSPKESDKSAEEFLLVLLCALDKLPVNLHALHTSNVGKSVNHLRSHKNSEIQKKAKTLVDTWKKRVEAEIDMIEAKTGSTRGGSWPNTGRSPARNANGGSFEDPAATLSKSSPPAQPEKLDHLDRKVKGKSDAVQAGSASNINVDLFQGGDGLVRSDEGNVSTPNAIGNEWSRTADDGGKLMEASKVIGSSSGVTPKPGKSYDASFSSINALIESCFKFSEASTTASGGDDFWMNLLASVPAGEMSRSDVSPSGSLRRNSPVLEESCSGNDVKSRHLDEDTAQTEDLNIGEANGDAILKQGNSVDSLHVGGDLGQAELEARKRAQEAEDTTILAKVSKFKESQADRPQKSIARERIRPRPKPLGEKDLGGFEPRPPPVDPLKERAYKKMEVEGVVKKKRRVKRSEEESVLKRRKDMTAEETPMAKEAGVGEIPGRVVAPEVVEVASEVVEVVPVVAEIAQEIQVEGGATGPEPRGEEQPQGGPAPQGGGGVRLTTAIYHARAVSKRLEGEEGLVRAAADRLVEIVDEAAVRSVAKFNEDELLRGLCSAQMEVTTLVGVLLRKMATAKVKSDEAKAQLANFKRDSAGWKKAARSACSRGWQEVEKAKKMQVLAIVYRNVADRAQAELIAVKLELEDERRQVVSLEFQLADEQKKLGDAQKACAVAIERHEEAMTSNEELRAQQIKEKDEADVKIAGLQKELEDERAKAMEERANLQKELEDERAKTASERASLQKELEEERTKTASERAAYPDLYVAAIEKFKGFAEFQMAIDAAVASNVAREVSGGAGPSETTAGGRTEAEVIESFQRSYLYKHEMAEFWDSGWKMFKRKAEELFPDLDLSSVKIDEDDVAQTPMDEGIEEEDLVSSEE